MTVIEMRSAPLDALSLEGRGTEWQPFDRSWPPTDSGKRR